MASEPKSIGAALVDVFDAAISLVKIEIRSLGRKISQTIRAKGLGVALLLSSVVPIGISIIFLLLGFYYMLIELAHLPYWGASMVMFLVALVVAGLVIFLGLKRLGDSNE